MNADLISQVIFDFFVIPALIRLAVAGIYPP